MRHKVKHVHFVGIGGSGMSGIAEVMLNLGFQVTGSDLNDSATVSHLRSLGAKVQIGHDRANISGANAVVTSTAVKADNPEVAAARAKRIPVVPRAMMLAELMRLKQGIAVAGTHGKTTTTSLIASVLAEADMDPTYVIGGRLEAAGSNAKLGTGEFIEPQLAILVGQTEPLEAAFPDVAELSDQHAAEQHADDEGRRDVQIERPPRQPKHEQRSNQQCGAEQPLQESITNAEQDRYENHPGERRHHEQGVVRR